MIKKDATECLNLIVVNVAIQEVLRKQEANGQKKDVVGGNESWWRYSEVESRVGIV